MRRAGASDQDGIKEDGHPCEFRHVSDKKTIHKAVLALAAKSQFGMAIGKPVITKTTGIRNVTSEWSISRKTISTQWRNDSNTKKSIVEGTLFVNGHSKFCMLGEGTHHGGSGRHE